MPGALPQQAPALGQDGPVQAGLLCHPLAWLGESALGRAGHVLDVELLEPHQVIVAGEHGAGLLAPVLTSVRLSGLELRDLRVLGGLLLASLGCAGGASLVLADLGPLFGGELGAVEGAAVRQCGRDLDASVDADDLARTGRVDQLGDDSEGDVPLPVAEGDAERLR